ncbi:thiamine-phosphate kinase [candidate division KSB1 bacterium]|nr:thiamine-phosphate kinase [candidate division KSB1 bacterium]
MVHNRQTIGDIGEFGLIEKIKTLIPQFPTNDIVLHIGDDTAAIKIDEGKLLLVTCDIQLEKQHFYLEHTTPYNLGRRAMSINLSDIAAMGGRPTYALISLGLPARFSYQDFKDLYQGFIDQSIKYDSIIVGGNITRSESCVVIDITLMGEIEPDRLIRRDGAQVGDRIYITGDPGFSGAGLQILGRFGNDYPKDLAPFVDKHLNPEPRVTTGREISMRRIANSMIDVSDGIASDLNHICEASGTGAVLYIDRLPGREQLVAVKRYMELDIQDVLLHAGEDYELLFTVPTTVPASEISDVQQKTGIKITEIGQIIDLNEGYYLIDDTGVTYALKPSGWDHYKSASSIGSNKTDERETI